MLTVQLDDDDVGEEQEEEVEFYLLFLGSTQRHLASTLRVSHVTLQAVCPGISDMYIYTHIHSHSVWAFKGTITIKNFACGGRISTNIHCRDTSIC